MYQPPHSGRALRNESKYSYIVELAVGADGLDLEVSRRVMEFHESRHTLQRNGRTIYKEGEIYYRWCFSDLTAAAPSSDSLAESSANVALEIRRWAELLTCGEARRIAANVAKLPELLGKG